MSESRFIQAPEHISKMVNSIVESSSIFNYLLEFNIVVMMDNKKRISGGKFVIGRMKKANDLEKALYVDTEGSFQDIDFILFLDNHVFSRLNEKDQIRIIRHELNHASVTEKGEPAIAPHEVNDFYNEIEFNSDEPNWLDKVAVIAESIYEDD